MAQVEGISKEDMEPKGAAESGEAEADPEVDSETEGEVDPDDGESGPFTEGEPDDEPGEQDPDAEPEGEEPGPVADDLPEGFSSREEMIAAAKASRRNESELLRLREIVYAGQRPAQAAHEKPAAWIPGADDPEVVRAWQRTAGNPEAIKSLPGDLAGRVSNFERSVSDKWAGYQADPSLLVRDHVIPMLEGSVFARELLAVKRELAVLRGREFLTQNAGVIRTPKDRQELADLIERGVDRDTALRVIAAEKKAAAAEAKAVKVAPKAQAAADAKTQRRASQADKRGGQRPGRPGQAPQTTNVRELFEKAKELHRNK